jgi:hypothetical protein
MLQPGGHPNPLTPIPPRASAQPPNAAPGSFMRTNRGTKHQRYEQRDLSSLRGDSSALDARRNLPVWENELAGLQAASNLPAFSLVISDTPTQPELTSRGKETRRLPHIDEIDTTPALSEASSIESSKALVLLPSQVGMTTSSGYGETTIHVQSVDDIHPSSWTAGEGSQSSYARLISSRNKRNTISFNPIDRLRWWLLRPGRIEFLLWLLGTILLVGVTCTLVLVTAFSFEWFAPRYVGTSTVIMSGNSKGSQKQATVVKASDMTVVLADTGPLLPGQFIHLHGQGFSPRGRISFLFDGRQPLPDQSGNIDSTQADGQGIFTTTLRLSDNLLPGSHFIDVQDLTSTREVKLPIFLAPVPIGKGVPSTPVPSSSPAVSPTPIPGGQQPTPVGQTPVPITPTVTPTVGNTPTATPTAGNTPTATPIVTPTAGKTIGLTPTASPSATGNPILGNSLYNTVDPALDKQLTQLSPWVWFMMACYSMSMVLLGLAGVLHKHRR